MQRRVLRLSRYVMHAPPVRLPVVGQLFAWQTVSIFVGLPGLVMAALMATVRETRRREQVRLGVGDSVHLSLVAVAGFLLGRWRMYASHRSPCVD